MPRRVVLFAASVLMSACARGGGAQAPAGVAPDSFLVNFETSRGPMTALVHRAWSPAGADRLYWLLKQQIHFLQKSPHHLILPKLFPSW